MSKSVKERPILFNADMVRAVIREYEQPGTGMCEVRMTSGFCQVNKRPAEWCVDPESVDVGASCRMVNVKTGDRVYVSRPYGCVGDRLWVKEDYRLHGRRGRVLYRASGPDTSRRVDLRTAFVKGIKSPWSKALFMKRDAARIVLEVVDVRVERLLDISWWGACKSGVECVWDDEETSAALWRNYLDAGERCIRAEESFFTMWESLHGREGLERNYWCWVYKFRVLTINGKLS